MAGKDDRGIVIQMLEEKMDPDACKDMIYGASDPLFSSYHVSYNMVLNMLRVEDADPENLLRSSFHQYQQECEAPALENRANELQREASLIQVGSSQKDEENVSAYQSLLTSLNQIRGQIRETMMSPGYCKPYFNSGRLFFVQFEEETWGWGVLVDYRKYDSSLIKPHLSVGFGHNSPSLTAGGAVVVSGSSSDSSEFILSILLQVIKVDATVEPSSKRQSDVPVPTSVISPLPSSSAFDDEHKAASTPGAGAVSIELVQVSLSAIKHISQIKLEVPRDLVKETVRKNLFRSLREIRRRFRAQLSDTTSELVLVPDNLPVLNPVTDMGIDTQAFSTLLSREKELIKHIENSSVHRSPERQTMLEAYKTKCALLEHARVQKQAAKESQTLTMRDELRKRKRILKRLGYTTAAGVLTPKGRFSCELSTGDELVLTDMVFEGLFNGLSVEQTVAILSCFVHKEGGADNDAASSGQKIRGDMQDVLRKLQSIARTVAKVSAECLLSCDEEEYVKSFNPALIDVSDFI
jgi:ATP-dependent RNA helicase DOB1